MTTQAKACTSTVIPNLRYRDAIGAIDWLIRAFGFEKNAVYLGPDNTTVMHAQLTFGNGMIMRAVGDRMIVAPPLVITRAEVDELVAKARRCLDLTLADAAR